MFGLQNAPKVSAVKAIWSNFFARCAILFSLCLAVVTSLFVLSKGASDIQSAWGVAMLVWNHIATPWFGLIALAVMAFMLWHGINKVANAQERGETAAEYERAKLMALPTAYILHFHRSRQLHHASNLLSHVESSLLTFEHMIKDFEYGKMLNPDMLPYSEYDVLGNAAEAISWQIERIQKLCEITEKNYILLRTPPNFNWVNNHHPDLQPRKVLKIPSENRSYIYEQQCNIEILRQASLSVLKTIEKKQTVLANEALELELHHDQ